MKTSKKHKGFTLIELIIIIVIVGLLSGLAVPKFIGIARDARVSSLIQDIDTLEKVIPVYYTKHEEYPLYMNETIAFKDNDPFFMALQKNGKTENNLYKVNLDKTAPYHSKLKYGNTDKPDDYFIYSMDTGKVYYAKGVMNGNGQLVFGHDIQTNNATLRNLALNDIPLVFNQTMEVETAEHILSGEVLADETVKVTHNGQPVSVQYDNVAYHSKFVNIYANNSKYKKFTAHLLLNISEPNIIEVSTSKETKTFIVKVNQVFQKPIAIITISPDGDLTTETSISFSYENSIADKRLSIVNAEWENMQPVYPEGTHTVRLRVQDSNGVWSDWTEETFYVVSAKNIIQIASKEFQSFALLKNGTVWAWGENYYSQLGDGTTTNRKTPVRVKNLSNVKQVAPGTHHGLALLEDGTVWAWGDNYYSQLGDGTTTSRKTPVQVQNLSNVKQVVAGYQHSLAVLQDGTVWAWGRNQYSQLGDETTTNRSKPIQVKTYLMLSKQPLDFLIILLC